MVQQHDRDLRLSGIRAGVTAGALWGFIFLPFKLLHSYGVLDIAAGRFAIYGVISIWQILRYYRVEAKSMLGTRAQICSAINLSLLSASLYYTLLGTAVVNAGIPITALIIGLLPVSIPVAINVRILKGNRHLWIGLALIIVGSLVLHVPQIEARSISRQQVIGIVCAVLALASWTTFSVLNRVHTDKYTEVRPEVKSYILGVFSFLTILPFWALSHAFHVHTEHIGPSSAFGFILAVSFLGAISTIAMEKWIEAERHTPKELLGFLLVSEILFSLFYSYAIIDRRWPSTTEFLAATLLIGGVIAGEKATRMPQNL